MKGVLLLGKETGGDDEWIMIKSKCVLEELGPIKYDVTCKREGGDINCYNLWRHLKKGHWATHSGNSNCFSHIFFMWHFL